jgi:hypothetical protein
VLVKSQKRKLRSLVRFDKGMNTAAVRRCCPMKESTIHCAKKVKNRSLDVLHRTGKFLFNSCPLPRKD